MRVLVPCWFRWLTMLPPPPRLSLRRAIHRPVFEAWQQLIGRVGLAGLRSTFETRWRRFAYLCNSRPERLFETLRRLLWSRAYIGCSSVPQIWRQTSDILEIQVIRTCRPRLRTRWGAERN